MSSRSAATFAGDSLAVDRIDGSLPTSKHADQTRGDCGVMEPSDVKVNYPVIVEETSILCNGMTGFLQVTLTGKIHASSTTASITVTQGDPTVALAKENRGGDDVSWAVVAKVRPDVFTRLLKWIEDLKSRRLIVSWQIPFQKSGEIDAKLDEIEFRLINAPSADRTPP